MDINVGYNKQTTHSPKIAIDTSLREFVSVNFAVNKGNAINRNQLIPNWLGTTYLPHFQHPSLKRKFNKNVKYAIESVFGVPTMQCKKFIYNYELCCVSVADFITDCCVIDPEATIHYNDLYNEYQCYGYEKNRFIHFSSFTTEMQALGHQLAVGNVYNGLRLKEV